VFAHVREVTQATALPLSVDLENGYGAAPEQAAAALVGAAEAGAVGGSIEDWDPETGICPLAQAAERVAAACEAAHRLEFPFTVTARAENLIRGNPDLDDTIARLLAYEEAGADVLFAPGLRDADQIRAVCAATSKPVNVLAHPKLTMREIVDAGAQRVSVGGALTWTAVNAMAAAAERLRDDGDFSVLGSSKRIQEWLRG
jgi:2-methylisocitrate lyase-like PEP mutase family enzyme